MWMEKYTVIYLTSIYYLIQVAYIVKVLTVDDNLQWFDTEYCDPFQM